MDGALRRERGERGGVSRDGSGVQVDGRDDAVGVSVVCVQKRAADKRPRLRLVENAASRVLRFTFQVILLEGYGTLNRGHLAISLVFVLPQ